LDIALADPDVRASLRVIAPELFDNSIGSIGPAGADKAGSAGRLTNLASRPSLLEYLNEPPNSEAFPTIGQWGRATRSSPRL
jgi:hypothetical protein